MEDSRKIICGDALEVLKTLPSESVDCCVTSPPYYGLRDYGTGDRQIGLENNAEEYIKKLVNVFGEVKRVLKDDGTLWVNIGDSYAGNCSRTSTGRAGLGDKREGIFQRKDAKPKDLIGIPWMLAFALREDGWYLRQDIIWAKPNPMPESVKDRCTKSHEYIFLLSKSNKYYFDYEAIQEEAKEQNVSGDIRFGGNKYGENDDKKMQIYSGEAYRPRTKNMMEDGQPPNTMHKRREEGMGDIQYVVRNKRDVWNIPLQPTKEAHFATYPEKLVEPCILAGCRPGGVVLDPFFGSGTTGRVADRLGRDYIGIELNPKYIDICKKRTNNVQSQLF